jgi:hypothetical protein
MADAAHGAGDDTSPGFSVTMICEATPPSGVATMP